MRRLVIALVAAALMAAMATPVAQGVEPAVDARRPSAARLVITADMVLPPDVNDPILGEFRARGAAVGRGGVCPAGTVAGARTGGGGPGFDFTVTHVFTCDDGSGTFSIDLWVRLSAPRRTAFVWSIGGGTGDYAGLAGAGTGFGRPSPLGDDIVRDHYRGRVGG